MGAHSEFLGPDYRPVPDEVIKGKTDKEIGTSLQAIVDDTSAADKENGGDGLMVQDVSEIYEKAYKEEKSRLQRESAKNVASDEAIENLARRHAEQAANIALARLKGWYHKANPEMELQTHVNNPYFDGDKERNANSATFSNLNRAEELRHQREAPLSNTPGIFRRLIKRTDDERSRLNFEGQAKFAEGAIEMFNFRELRAMLFSPNLAVAASTLKSLRSLDRPSSQEPKEDFSIVGIDQENEWQTGTKIEMVLAMREAEDRINFWRDILKLQGLLLLDNETPNETKIERFSGALGFRIGNRQADNPEDLVYRDGVTIANVKRLFAVLVEEHNNYPILESFPPYIIVHGERYGAIRWLQARVLTGKLDKDVARRIASAIGFEPEIIEEDLRRFVAENEERSLSSLKADIKTSKSKTDKPNPYGLVGAIDLAHQYREAMLSDKSDAHSRSSGSSTYVKAFIESQLERRLSPEELAKFNATWNEYAGALWDIKDEFSSVLRDEVSLEDVIRRLVQFGNLSISQAQELFEFGKIFMGDGLVDSPQKKIAVFNDIWSTLYPPSVLEEDSATPARRGKSMFIELIRTGKVRITTAERLYKCLYGSEIVCDDDPDGNRAYFKAVHEIASKS